MCKDLSVVSWSTMILKGISEFVVLDVVHINLIVFCYVFALSLYC